MNRTGWVVAAMAVALLVVSVSGQPAFQDGAFVRGPDGSTWVVTGGQKRAITWTEGTADALAALPDGEAIANVGAVPPVARVAPAAAPETPAPTAAPVIRAEPPAYLLQQSGSGDIETDNFQATQRVRVCWDVSGNSGSANIPGRASIWLIPAGTATYDQVLLFQETPGCSFLNLRRAGSYYLKVTATSWTRWTVTIYPA